MPVSTDSVRWLGSAIMNGAWLNDHTITSTSTERRPSGKSTRTWPKSHSIRSPGSCRSGISVWRRS